MGDLLKKTMSEIKCECILHIQFFFYFYHICISNCCCLVTRSVWHFANPWTAACQAPLSSTISQRLLKFMSTESMTLSNHLILCRPLLLLPSILSSIKVFYNASALWPCGQSIGVSASSSVLPMYIQSWFPLGLTALIPLLSRDSQESSPSSQFERINCSVLSLFYGPILTSVHD